MLLYVRFFEDGKIMVDGSCLTALLAKEKVDSPMFIPEMVLGNITSQGVLLKSQEILLKNF